MRGEKGALVRLQRGAAQPEHETRAPSHRPLHLLRKSSFFFLSSSLSRSRCCSDARSCSAASGVMESMSALPIASSTSSPCPRKRSSCVSFGRRGARVLGEHGPAADVQLLALEVAEDLARPRRAPAPGCPRGAPPARRTSGPPSRPTTLRRKTTSPFHSFAVIVRFTTSRLHERHLRQLVVVRREENAPRAGVVQVLGDRPRERESVERRRAAPDLVQDDEALLRRVPEDVRRLGHLDEERRLAAHERVGRADPREDAVAQPHARRRRGHERARVREEDEDRVLTQIRRLAAHVRARQDDDVRPLAAERSRRSGRTARAGAAPRRRDGVRPRRRGRAPRRAAGASSPRRARRARRRRARRGARGARRRRGCAPSRRRPPRRSSGRSRARARRGGRPRSGASRRPPRAPESRSAPRSRASGA